MVFINFYTVNEFIRYQVNIFKLKIEMKTVVLCVQR